MDAWTLVRDLLGIGEDQLSTGEMLLRLLIVLPLAILMVRTGEKRFFADLYAFDLVVAVMLGSILSRAITGNAPFVPALAAGFGLILLHRLLTHAGYHSDRIGRLIKGSERRLIRDGEVQWEEMRKAGIGERDLRSALRRKAGREDLDDIEAAYLERTGDISVILRRERGAKEK